MELEIVRERARRSLDKTRLDPVASRTRPGKHAGREGEKRGVHQKKTLGVKSAILCGLGRVEFPSFAARQRPMGRGDVGPGEQQNAPT